MDAFMSWTAVSSTQFEMQQQLRKIIKKTDESLALCQYGSSICDLSITKLQAYKSKNIKLCRKWTNSTVSFRQIWSKKQLAQKNMCDGFQASYVFWIVDSANTNISYYKINLHL